MQQEFQLWNDDDNDGTISNENTFEKELEAVEDRKNRLLKSDTRPQLGLINKQYSEWRFK